MARIGQRLSPAVLQAIVAQHLLNKPHKEIAKALDIHVATVARHLKKYRDLAPLAGESEDYRKNMRRYSISAITAGLRADADPYKRGSLGVQVMKGIGEFRDTGVQVGVFGLQPPQDWKERYAGELEREEPA